MATMSAERPSTPLAVVLMGGLGALALAFPAAAQEQPLPSLEAFGLLVAVQSRPSFAVLGAGARAAGMGGAFTALADDASAASFNPAGLALLITPEASFALDGREHSDNFSGFDDVEDGQNERYSASASELTTWTPNFASFTLPFTVGQRNLTFQLSYHRPISFDFESDRRFTESIDGALRARLRQNVVQRGDIQTFGLAAAYQLTERLSLGLTVSRWVGDWTFSTSTTKADVDGESRALRFSQRNQLRGWNYGAGFLLRYRYVNVGAAVRSAFTGDFSIDSRLTTDFPTQFGPRSTATGTLEWPRSWTVGLAFKPRQTWFITLDYANFDWDDMELRGFGVAGSAPVNFFDLAPRGQSRTRNAGQWRLGSELTLLRGRQVIGLRAGAFLEPQPQLLAPGDDENTLRGVSIGFGWKLGKVTLDLAFQRTTVSARLLQLVDPEILSEGVVEAQAEGHVDTREERVYLSVLYQFDSRADLGRLAHFLFVGPLARDVATPENAVP
jgi:long-subunit fatty acid transport protein